MTKFSQTLEYRLKTTLDNSGMTKLNAELKKVENELRRLGDMNLLDKGSVSDAIGDIGKLERALKSAFNPNMGMLDMKKFSEAIKQEELSVKSLQNSLAKAGAVGNNAFNDTIGRLGQLDKGVRSISKTTDKIFNTIGNTVRWGIVSSGFSQMMNAAHQTAEYVKDLDASLTNIMMVTNYSKEAMNDYAKKANEAAKALGSTTVAMTDATLVFAQQGAGNFSSNR